MKIWYIFKIETTCEFESRSDELYSIQHYVIKSVTCDRSVVFPENFFSTNKTDRYDIAEILSGA